MSSEQFPNAHSRVLLSEERDRFGLRRPALDWRLTPADKDTIRTFSVEFGKYLARSGTGFAKVHPWVLEDSASFPGLDDGEEVGGFHHMGTTRMGADARDGVVDRDCKVFGIDNLYVAGSSVFRTSGHANPTLSLVQLALRLADHLAKS
jgi:choline dehydrogenase-like flavoprotein